MEKRVKAHSLAGLLWGYLLAAGALCIAVCFAALFSFQLLMNCGFILPASAGSEAAAQGAALAAGYAGGANLVSFVVGWILAHMIPGIF